MIIFFEILFNFKQYKKGLVLHGKNKGKRNLSALTTEVRYLILLVKQRKVFLLRHISFIHEMRDQNGLKEQHYHD